LALVGSDHILVIEVVVMIGEAVVGICATATNVVTTTMPPIAAHALMVFIIFLDRLFKRWPAMQITTFYRFSISLFEIP
jgi:hypothetical protein